VTSIHRLGKTAIVNLLISNDDIANNSKYISQMIQESTTELVVFPLIGKGQDDLIAAITEELGGSLKRRSMTLMRKHL
ncbi:MAG: hypothetical protein ACFFEV_07980, partial [Candidatus Thorarchaeota archaeon]